MAGWGGGLFQQCQTGWGGGGVEGGSSNDRPVGGGGCFSNDREGREGAVPAMTGSGGRGVTAMSA